MATVLFVSKPVVPPWNDSSKNLVRDVAGHMKRHQAVLMGPPTGVPTLGSARFESVYAPTRGAFAPGMKDNARVLARLMAGASHDIWHFFFAPNPRTSSVARVASALRRVPTVQTVCSAPREDVDPRAVLFAERVIVLSKHTLARLREAGVAEQRLVHIPPSAPALDAPTEAARAASRSAFGLPGAVPLLLFPGDLEFGKGAERSLRTLAALPSGHAANLVMACRAKTPHAKQVEAGLRELARELRVESRVHWLGETPRILELLAVADVVLLPSETLYAKMDLPLVLLEAMALQRPVVVANGVPAAELAEGEGALAVPAEVDALVATVSRLLDDAGARAALGQRAREVVLSRYQPGQVAAAYETVYDALLKASRTRGN